MITKNSHHHKLSIGLPVFNGERFLSEALDSLIRQTFKDFEIIICDNASTDRTAEICSAYANRDRRIRYHRNEKNIGAAANFCLAFGFSKAPLFKWAAHDDLYLPSYLSSCVSTLDNDPGVVLAHSATAFIDDAGDVFPFETGTGRYIDPRTGVLQTPDSPSIAESGGPASRFWQVLSRARWGSHIFGVMPRQALERTKILPNFAGSDRVTLAELAVLGRFKCTSDRLYLKRFHEGGSWALNQKELKSFLGGGKNYSRRHRQVEAFFSAPWGKPVGFLDKSVCTLMVAAHCGKIIAQMARRKEARNAAQGEVWRGGKGNTPFTKGWVR